MPDGWTYPEPFDYLMCKESFSVGTRYFARGDFVRNSDVMANKLLYECPRLGSPR